MHPRFEKALRRDVPPPAKPESWEALRTLTCKQLENLGCHAVDTGDGWILCLPTGWVSAIPEGFELQTVGTVFEYERTGHVPFGIYVADPARTPAPEPELEATEDAIEPVIAPEEVFDKLADIEVGADKPVELFNLAGLAPSVLAGGAIPAPATSEDVDDDDEVDVDKPFVVAGPVDADPWTDDSADDDLDPWANEPNPDTLEPDDELADESDPASDL